jgi:hypothetical protein
MCCEWRKDGHVLAGLSAYFYFSVGTGVSPVLF